MRERGAVRVVPKSAVKVALAGQGGPAAHGLVANISDGGVCVWTDGAFQIGETLVLQLRFAREPEPFQAAGRIIGASGIRMRRGRVVTGCSGPTPPVPNTPG